MLQSVCPILPSRNFDRTVESYAALGFAVGARFDDQGYLIVQCDDVELHFFLAPGAVPETSDHGAYLRVLNAWDISTQYAAVGLPNEGIPRLLQAEEKPWGMCELAVIDCDGNLIHMGHDLAAQA